MHFFITGILVGLSAISASANQTCGTTPIMPITDKIVGGTVAKPYSWPWQIEFCQHSSWWGNSCSLMCGGSIIGPNWVVTAGHCVYGNTNKPGNFRVKAGVFDQSQTSLEAGAVELEIDTIYLHPDYVSSTTSHDIALLKLKTPITYTNHIQPVCLAADDSDLTGTVTVTGWGTTSESGDVSEDLRQVTVPMVPIATCVSEYNAVGETVMSNVMFCAGTGGKDSCQGDSGGPVVVQTAGGYWRQHGIVSWGDGCARANFPGVYSKVSAYCSWIKSTSGISCV